MISLGIDVVNADCISAQLGHANKIALALCGVNQGILRDELISNAYVDCTKLV